MDVTVSVVIAHTPGVATLDDCVAAHLAELRPGDDAFVVSEMEVRCLTPFSRLRCERRSLVPAMWALGVRHARGDWVRLTSSTIVPTAGWRDAIARAHAAGLAGVGGPIVPGRALRAVGRAIHLLRFREYGAMPDLPPPPREPDVAADHAAYERAALLLCEPIWQSAFWEVEVHEALRAAGRPLALDPAFEAAHVGAEPLAWMIGARLRHGVHFGWFRAARATRLRRAVHVVTFALPGLVFLARITRWAARHGGLRRWGSAAPALLVLVAAWSIGEWWGWVRRSGTRSPST